LRAFLSGVPGPGHRTLEGATWCPNCLDELPGLAQLKKRNAGNMVLLLVDGLESAPKPKIQQLLASKGHNSTFIFRDDIEGFFKKFDPKFRDNIAFPITYIYKRDGSRARTITGDHTAAQYQKMLAPYLKK
jgi:thiol-disulfide isomerase/thioredoxin